MTDEDDGGFDFATLDNISLANFSPAEEARAEAERLDAISSEIVRQYTEAMEQALLAATGAQLETKPRAARSSAPLIPQEMWNYRMKVFMGLIEFPERALKDNPIATAWKEFYPNIEYGKWVSSSPIGRYDRPKLRVALKDAGIKKRGQLQTVADLTRIVREHAESIKLQEVSKLIKEKDEGFRSLEMAIDNQTGAIWYRGIEIKRTNDRFKVVVGGQSLRMRHGALDKVAEFFKTIDTLLDHDKI